MKTPLIIQVQLALVLIGFMACKTDNIMPTQNTDSETGSIVDSSASRLVIRIGSKRFHTSVQCHRCGVQGTLTTNGLNDGAERK